VKGVLFFLLVWGCFGSDRCLGELPTATSGSNPNGEIIFEQRLNVPVSQNILFTNEVGDQILLRDLFHGRPLVLAMGYYQCSMLCGVILNAFVQSLLEFPPQSSTRDFDFVFISVDPTEGSQLALAKKGVYVRRYGSQAAQGSWHFLTGPRESIQTIADEIGFHFRYDSATKQYVHPSGIVVLTPEGRISSYMLGVEFPPSQLQQAIVLARQQEIGKAAKNIWLLCLSSSSASGPLGRIVILALRTGAVLTLVGLLLVIRFARGRKP
jgi:protein SCO1